MGPGLPALLSVHSAHRAISCEERLKKGYIPMNAASVWPKPSELLEQCLREPTCDVNPEKRAAVLRERLTARNCLRPRHAAGTRRARVEKLRLSSAMKDAEHARRECLQRAHVLHSCHPERRELEEGSIEG